MRHLVSVGMIWRPGARFHKRSEAEPKMVFFVKMCHYGWISMMRLIYEEMMIEKDVRNFILRIGKIEISGISQKFLSFFVEYVYFGSYKALRPICPI